MSEIMSSPVTTIDASATGDAAWNEMRIQNTHHLVVKQGRDIVGIVSSRDLTGRRDRLVAELMSRDVVTADPETTVHKAANLLRGRYIGCLPIVESGKLVGIVSISDLLELLGRGAVIPSPRGERWTLKSRGVRKRPHVESKRRMR
ncbi:MAG: CBS domain-containing protein [Polyangia bacterium]